MHRISDLHFDALRQLLCLPVLLETASQHDRVVAVERGERIEHVERHTLDLVHAVTSERVGVRIACVIERVRGARSAEAVEIERAESLVPGAQVRHEVAQRFVAQALEARRHQRAARRAQNVEIDARNLDFPVRAFQHDVLSSLLCEQPAEHTTVERAGDILDVSGFDRPIGVDDEGQERLRTMHAHAVERRPDLRALAVEAVARAAVLHENLAPKRCITGRRDDGFEPRERLGDRRIARTHLEQRHGTRCIRRVGMIAQLMLTLRSEVACLDRPALDGVEQHLDADRPLYERSKRGISSLSRQRRPRLGERSLCFGLAARAEQFDRAKTHVGREPRLQQLRTGQDRGATLVG